MEEWAFRVIAGLVGFAALVAYKTISKRIEDLSEQKLNKEVFQATVDRIDSSLNEIKETLHDHREALKQNAQVLTQIARDIDWMRRNGK